MWLPKMRVVLIKVGVAKHNFSAHYAFSVTINLPFRSFSAGHDHYYNTDMPPIDYLTLYMRVFHVCFSNGG